MMIRSRPFGLDMYRLTDPDGPYRLGYKRIVEKWHILREDVVESGPALCGFKSDKWILAPYGVTERNLCRRCASVALREVKGGEAS